MALNNLGEAYRESRQPGRAAECWRRAAAAIRDVGEHNQAVRPELRTTNARSRRRWRACATPECRCAMTCLLRLLALVTSRYGNEALASASRLP
jgi:hypothetical protein